MEQIVELNFAAGPAIRHTTTPSMSIFAPSQSTRCGVFCQLRSNKTERSHLRWWNSSANLSLSQSYSRDLNSLVRWEKDDREERSLTGEDLASICYVWQQDLLSFCVCGCQPGLSVAGIGASLHLSPGLMLVSSSPRMAAKRKCQVMAR
ncbi:hypothetical protein Pst134EB_008873 [Puccinia striiformis f. sp. tritici]|nr:hypothetical protein Pst134EB_008873 [Puccinia striiformis f. sp. tritici]